jgi:hypothetical protein
VQPAALRDLGLRHLEEVGQRLGDEQPVAEAIAKLSLEGVHLDGVADHHDLRRRLGQPPVQRADHARLDRLMARARATVDSGGVAHQVALRAVARLVFTHAFAEESVLWPAIRRALPDGEDLTARIEEEHQEINETMTRLEQTDPDGAERPALVQRVVDLMRADVRDEEDVLLPRLQEALEVAELRRLGVRWELVRRTAPTHPHPFVSRRPPGNVLAAVPLSVLDRTGDVLDRATGRLPGSARPLVRAASRSLRAGAQLVEQVPVLRRGERSETSRTPAGGER